MATASPSGAQVVFDGENPRSFTGVSAGSIYGGQLVVSNAGTTAQKVGSIVSTYSANDVEILPVKDSNHVNGIALQTVMSGTSNYVPVATRGTYILRAAGIISGGQTLTVASGTIQGVRGQAISVTSGTVSSTGTAEAVVGRALTNSASGTDLYVLASLNL